MGNRIIVNDKNKIKLNIPKYLKLFKTCKMLKIFVSHLA